MRQNMNSRLPRDLFRGCGLIVTAEKQSFRMLSIRNHSRPGFVQYVTNIRLGTGRGFRYAYSQQLESPIVAETPSGVRPDTREDEDASVEASSTPRLAMSASATGEMEWVI
jgi:hypothetical protein